MGARKKHAPRRGSLGVRPRKRASDILPRVKSWPEIDPSQGPLLLAFIGYKAGMTHALIIDDRENSLTAGREIFAPITVIETPPIIPLAIRAYRYKYGYGLLTFTEAWIDPPRELEIERAISTFSAGDFDKRIDRIKENLDKIADIRVIIASQPKKAGGLEKKKPDLLEVKIGGSSIEDRLNYALGIIGKEVTIDQVFRPGQFIDVIGVTKGKGFGSVIKRFGVKELPRWHKHRKGSRKIGARSPGIGTVSEAPQPGQLGYHRRTEYNKRIILMGSDGYTITPSGGFPHYGIVRSHFIGVLGSVMGPPKRPLVLRHPIRPPEWRPTSAPEIVYLSLTSKQ